MYFFYALVLKNKILIQHQWLNGYTTPLHYLLIIAQYANHTSMWKLTIQSAQIQSEVYSLYPVVKLLKNLSFNTPTNTHSFMSYQPTKMTVGWKNLSHLENTGSTVRMMFFDISSAHRHFKFSQTVQDRAVPYTPESKWG